MNAFQNSSFERLLGELYELYDYNYSNKGNLRPRHENANTRIIIAPLVRLELTTHWLTAS
jgi:hypothetical protein